MIAPPRSRTPTTGPRTAEAVAEVLTLAAEHAALDPVKARMYRFEVKRLTSGKQRFMALLAHPTSHSLIGLLNALVADQDGYQTAHGFLSRDDIAGADGKIGHEGDRTWVRFPILHPWAVKPDEHGNGGYRAEPIYRDVTPTVEPDAPAQEWWERMPGSNGVTAPIGATGDRR